MASSMKSLSFFFLLIAICISLMQIEASDRLYFSKVNPSSNNYYNNALYPKLPINFQQEAKQPAPQFPTLTSKRQALPPPPPRRQPSSFSRDEYPQYGFSDSTKDTSTTSYANFEDRNNNNNNDNNDNNDGDSFIYNMENRGEDDDRNDDISGEFKQQGFGDARSSEIGRDSFGQENEDRNRFKGYKRGAAWSRSTARSDDVGERGNSKQNEFDSEEEYENYLRRNGYLP